MIDRSFSAPAGRLAARRPGPARVLLVEDDAALQELIADYLREEGYEVVSACTVAEAIRSLRQKPVDLVLADSLWAPAWADAGDRWSRLEQVRAAAGDTPVVIFTAYDADDFADFAQRGFRDLVLKPVTLGYLCHVVARHIRVAPS